MDPAADTLELITAPHITAPHGFTTRAGGVSEGPFASLNLGLSSGDVPDKVEANREIVLHHFGVGRDRVCAFHQVHSARVLEGSPSWFELEADGAVTNEPGLLLVVSAADCLPILFHDPVAQVVGAAHGGWRGTVKGIAAVVLDRMRELYGSSPEHVRVAVGPCISGVNYQVGGEVVDAFKEAGFPDSVYTPDVDGRYRLDLLAANRWLLLERGVQEANIWDLGVCTFDDARFFSYRRDCGRTGRQWGAIRL